MPIKLRRQLMSSGIAVGAMMALSQSAFAQGYCDRISVPGMSLGCAETLGQSSPIIGGYPNPPSQYMDSFIGVHDGLIWDSDWIARLGRNRLEFQNSVQFDNDFYTSWQNVYLGSTRATGRTAVAMTALPRASINVEHLDAVLQFDTLTLENTALELVTATSLNGLQTGRIDTFIIGDGVSGNGGVLTLRNSSLDTGGSRLLMNAPGNNAAIIRAESGANEIINVSSDPIANELHVDISAGADLAITGNIGARTEGALTIGTGGRLVLDGNAQLSLVQNAGSSLPRTTIDGGRIEIDGNRSQLTATNMLVRDSEITLSTGGTLQVQQRDDNLSTIRFEGNSLLDFQGANGALLGSTAIDRLTMEVGTGTTRVVSDALATVGRGLLADTVRVDGGTLDLTGYNSALSLSRSLDTLEVVNGGTFTDDNETYGNLEVLTLDGATIASNSNFGSFSVDDGIGIARVNNTEFDLTGASAGLTSSGLGRVTIDARNLSFSGDNTVRLGISPNGECVNVSGSCVPGTTRYSGDLVLNVGNSSIANSTGFGSLMFVPMATDPSADVASYVAGGENGIYTVAYANLSDDVIFMPQGFDAAPMTPTVADLSANGSDIPADLTYVIVNNPVTDNQVDIAFVDVGLTNNPLVTMGYNNQVTNTVIVEPMTNNVTAVTISILPDAEVGVPNSVRIVEPLTGNVTTITQTATLDPVTGGNAQEITTIITEPNGSIISTESVVVPLHPTGSGGLNVITTTITEPDGDHISTTTSIATLDPPTGTTNTGTLGTLITGTDGHITHGGLTGIETLHPEIYASYITVALEHSDLRRNMVLSNARGVGVADGSSEGFTDDGRRIWMDTAITEGTVDSDGNLAGFSYDLGEIIVGADLWSTPESRIGAYAGYGTYSLDEHTSAIASNLSSTAFHLGAYGAYDVDDWSLTGMAGVSWAQTDGTRTAITASGVNTHGADYDSRTIEAAVRAEYNGWEPLGAFSFAPEFGLGYAHYRQDGFTETGDGASALILGGTSAESFVASLGLNFSGPEFGGGLIPIGFARYEHDFLASSQGTHDIDAAFAASPGASQTFVGTHRGPNSVSLGLGLRAAEGSTYDVSAGIVYTTNSYGEEFGGGLRISWKF